MFRRRSPPLPNDESGERRVNILDRVEQTFERLVEGSIGRVFRNQIQPAEIGRKLERAMLEKQVVSVGATIVPNDFRVSLHSRDLKAFEDYLAALCRQMETWLTDVAADRGLTLVDRAKVDIRADDKLPRRAIMVAATITDRPSSGRRGEGALQRTEIFRQSLTVDGPAVILLQVINGPHRGQELDLCVGTTTVGRATDNDLVLASGDVSRHHARIERDGDQVRVIDLNSTNGTKVNGRPIQDDYVQAGDEVTFGASTVRLASSDRARR